jgi:thioredoxin-related protein
MNHVFLAAILITALFGASAPGCTKDRSASDQPARDVPTAGAAPPATVSAESPPSNQAHFDPKRDPQLDLDRAITVARQSNKRIILDVGGDWCPWCHVLDKFVTQEPSIREYLAAHYVVVRVNYSDDNPNEAFLSRYPKITGYPHLFVLDQDGKLLHSQDTGVLESGKSYNVEAFGAFLRKWAR